MKGNVVMNARQEEDGIALAARKFAQEDEIARAVKEYIPLEQKESAIATAISFLQNEADDVVRNPFPKNWAVKKDAAKADMSVKTVQDELYEALVEDESPKDQTLQEHDRQHHPDGFDPNKDTCKFREKQEKKDEADEVDIDKGVGRQRKTEEKSSLSPYVMSAGKPRLFAIGEPDRRGWTTGWGMDTNTVSGGSRNQLAFMELKNPLNLMEGFREPQEDETIDEREETNYKVNTFCDVMEKAGVNINRKSIEANFRSLENPTIEDLIDEVGSKTFEEALKKLGYDGFVGDDDSQVTAFDRDRVVVQGDELNNGPEPKKEEAQSKPQAKVYDGLSKKQVEKYTRQMQKKHPELDADLILTEIAKIKDKKLQGDAFAWVMKGAVRLPEDMYKVEQARELATKAKKDSLQWDTPQACINELLGKGLEVKEKPITVEELKKNPLMSDYRDEGYGVVTFQVDDSKEGQALMRRVIDTHWGKDANPWCLLARKKVPAWERQNNQEEYEKSEEWWRGLSKRDREEIAQKIYKPDTDADILEEFVGAESIGDAEGAEDYYYENVAEPLDELQSAWNFWNHYNVLPKRVAFKDGKLLAFMATDDTTGKTEDEVRETHPELYDEYNEWKTNTDIKIPPMEFAPLGVRKNYSFYSFLDRCYPDIIHTPKEQWWDRQDSPHAGLPLGETIIPDDKLNRKVESAELVSGRLVIPNMQRPYIGTKGKPGYKQWFSFDENSPVAEEVDREGDTIRYSTEGDIGSIRFSDGLDVVSAGGESLSSARGRDDSFYFTYGQGKPKTISVKGIGRGRIVDGGVSWASFVPEQDSDLDDDELFKKLNEYVGEAEKVRERWLSKISNSKTVQDELVEALSVNE